MSKEKILYKAGKAEIVEKKSRFIARIVPVNSEEEALEFIQAVKKDHWDARHNCYAYVIDENIQRFSDDREPSGTAGKPILEVLLSKNITKVCAVVTRYFGGVLLGTGGLIRAYQGATQEALDDSVIMDVYKGEKFKVTLEYSCAEKVQRLLEMKEAMILNIDYTEKVDFLIVVKEEMQDDLIKKISELSAGKATINSDGKVKYGVYNEKAILL